MGSAEHCGICTPTSSETFGAVRTTASTRKCSFASCARTRMRVRWMIRMMPPMDDDDQTHLGYCLYTTCCEEYQRPRLSVRVTSQRSKKRALRSARCASQGFLRNAAALMYRWGDDSNSFVVSATPATELLWTVGNPRCAEKINLFSCVQVFAGGFSHIDVGVIDAR